MLQKAKDEKQKTDNLIQALTARIKQIEGQKAVLESTSDQLLELQNKMRAARAWNIFVTVLGGAKELGEKMVEIANPEAVLIEAVGGFLKDAAFNAMEDEARKTTLTLRVKKISDTAQRLSPKAKKLQRTISMTNEQVADTLVSMGKNTQ